MSDDSVQFGGFDPEIQQGPGSAGRNRRPGPWVSVNSSRVTQARYDGNNNQIQVIFRDGTPWTYDGVPRNVWNNFRRSGSKGKYINRVLNDYSYWRGGFDYNSGADIAERNR